jgi:ribosomal protein S18 acetylase RimI-like enzyme
MISKRVATEADKEFIYSTKKEALFEYVNQIWGWDEEFQKKRFGEKLQIENIQIISSNGFNAGIFEVIKEDNYIELVNIELLPEYRNMGIGSKLIKELIQEAEQENRNIKLRVFKLNKKAIQLYERICFKMTGSTEFHYLFEYKA